MSDTPETDAVRLYLRTRTAYELTDFEIWENHAKKLESECRKARVSSREWSSWCVQYMSERDDLKVLLAQKTAQYEIAQKELDFIKHTRNEANFVFLDDLSSEAGHPEEVLAFMKGDVK